MDPIGTKPRPSDPHLHGASLTAADFSGSYNKSPEYMGEFATTTKPEEKTVRTHVKDLFDPSERTSEERQDNSDNDRTTTTTNK